MSEDSHHADHLDAARRVEQCREAIVAKWAELVCAQVEGAKALEETALRDDVPEILALVSDALRQGEATARTDFEPVRAHGEQRARLTHTNIRWVLEELHLLRSVVIDKIEEELGELTRKDLLLIYEVFQQVTTASTEAYSTWRLRQEEEARKESEASVRKLSQLARLLEEEREQRSLFVSAIVHDLRTPLASMQIATDLLANFIDRPGVRDRALDKLQRNIRRIDAMAQRLLDVNRISAGSRLPLDIEEVDLVEVAQSYVKDARSTYDAQEIYLDVGPNKAPEQAGPDQANEVRGWWNREALFRILSNLVENALKYGEPPVTVRIRPEADEVWLEVHDEGSPIPPEEQEHVFERFVRLKSAQQRNNTGWGIGLTLVRGLTHALGGRLQLDSSEGKGTTFRIRLPFDARPFQEE